MTRNLIEEIQEELTRNRELLKIYESIPTGGFGAAVIRTFIRDAEIALADRDTVSIIHAYHNLQTTE